MLSVLKELHTKVKICLEFEGDVVWITSYRKELFVYMNLAMHFDPFKLIAHSEPQNLTKKDKLILCHF